MDLFFVESGGADDGWDVGFGGIADVLEAYGCEGKIDEGVGFGDFGGGVASDGDGLCVTGFGSHGEFRAGVFGGIESGTDFDVGGGCGHFQDTFSHASTGAGHANLHW